MGKTQFTPEQKKAWKEEKQREQKQLLEDALSELASQEMWANFIKYGRPNLSKYSLNNSILIWIQKQDATLVHGRKQWLKEDIVVNEDAKPIHIFAPVMITLKDEEGNVIFDENGKPEKRVAFYKTVQVFDVKDTDAPAVENVQVMRKIEGDELMEKIPAIEKFVEGIGFSVIYENDTGTAQGSCNFGTRTVTVNAGLSGNDMVRTLVHEAAHAYGNVNYTDYTREEAETIVESATVMTLGMLGFDVRDASVPYILAWGGDLKVLRKFAGLIDDLTKELTKGMGL